MNGADFLSATLDYAYCHALWADSANFKYASLKSANMQLTRLTGASFVGVAMGGNTNGPDFAASRLA